MDMTGERLIAAPKPAVWAALNDPQVLAACIPGCESLERTSETEMTAAAAVKLGPVAAKFTGKLALSDLDPPNGYKLSGEGRGGPAGFAKGAAQVRLTEQPDGATLLSYTVNAQVGGKIAQVGGRLIEATAKAMSDQFFKCFAEKVEMAAAPPPPAETIPAPRAGDGLLARLMALLGRLFGQRGKSAAETTRA